MSSVLGRILNSGKVDAEASPGQPRRRSPVGSTKGPFTTHGLERRTQVVYQHPLAHTLEPAGEHAERDGRLEPGL